MPDNLWAEENQIVYLQAGELDESDCLQAFYHHSLNSTGICVVAAGSFALQLFQGSWMWIAGKNHIDTYKTETNTGDLVTMKELFEAGRVHPVIDQSYLLSQVPEALRYLEDGHIRGKGTITVEPSPI
ncbi:MAG: zinc-binding dehydrogenase [Anaerolineales bacterium]